MNLRNPHSDLDDLEPPSQTTEELNSILVEQSPVAIALFDSDLRCLAASRRWFEEFNLDHHYSLGKFYTDLFPNTPPAWPEIYQRCLAGEKYQSAPETVQLVNGSRVKLTWEIYPWRDRQGNIGGLIFHAQSVTQTPLHDLTGNLHERQHSPQDLLQEVIDTTPHWLCVRDWNGRFVMANHAIAEAFGTTPENLLGQTPADFHCDREQVERFQSEDREVMTALKDQFISEELFVTAAGQPVWIQTIKRPLFLPNTDLPHVLISATDITPRKQIEEDLQKFAALVANSSALIGIATLEGEPIFMNQAGLQLLGLNSLQEAQSKHIFDFIMPEDHDFFQRQIWPTILEKGSWQGEFRFQYLPTGTAIPIDYNGFVIKDGKTGEMLALATIVRDISDRKQAEAVLKRQAQNLERTLQELRRTQTQLIQTEKMSGLGQLVAGVAHEINNPVNFIYGNLIHAERYVRDILGVIELYQTECPHPSRQLYERMVEIDLDFIANDLPELLNSMKVGTERIRNIVTSLRNFSRMDEAEIKKVDIHEGLDSTLLILKNRLKATERRPEIQVIYEYGNLPPVECYAAQLNQVFLNVLNNAIDALDERDARRSLAENKRNPSMIHLRTEMAEPGQVKICITDNGPGIPQAIQTRLFDPFFTTKTVGQGTGLGLSISYQIIVEKHKGRLELNSLPGEGAEFLIAIPTRQSVLKRRKNP